MIYFNEIQEFSNKIALINENGETITFSELSKKSDVLVSSIKPRSLVFIMCSNSFESIVGYVGFLRNGIVPVLINQFTDNELLNQLEEQYRPQYLYYPTEKLTQTQLDNKVAEFVDYTIIETEYEIDYILNDELCVLVTTSGSTGSPKLVKQSYKNVKSNTESIIEYLSVNEKDIAITTLPMYYTYGLSIINTHLIAGGSLALTDKALMSKEFWEFFKTVKPTTFGGVPYIYEMLKKLRFSRMNLSSVRYITQAGGKFSKELSEEFAKICIEKNIEMIIMYGQTEATARMSYLPWRYAIEKAGSIGIPIPRGEFKLIDVTNKFITEPEIDGELVYLGDNVTLGYAKNRHDLIIGDENQGRLVTGDMAKKDAEGFYYIVGRKKRFLKIYGSRINLDEIESLLNSKGLECVCAGVDDNLKIYLLNEDLIEQVAEYLITRLKISRYGFEIKIISEIPRTDAGKVKYSILG